MSSLNHNIQLNVSWLKKNVFWGKTSICDLFLEYVNLVPLSYNMKGLFVMMTIICNILVKENIQLEYRKPRYVTERHCGHFSRFATSALEYKYVLSYVGDTDVWCPITRHRYTNNTKKASSVIYQCHLFRGFKDDTGPEAMGFPSNSKNTVTPANKIA